jgi:hypothetical protein
MIVARLTSKQAWSYSYAAFERAAKSIGAMEPDALGYTLDSGIQRE